eukprot:g5228.t1
MQIVTKWPHSDMFRKHRIFGDGKSNWALIEATWDLQVFFFNLFTCDQGSPVSGHLGVEPPSIAEYLESINTGQMIPQHILGM